MCYIGFIVLSLFENYLRKRKNDKAILGDTIYFSQQLGKTSFGMDLFYWACPKFIIWFIS